MIYLDETNTKSLEEEKEMKRTYTRTLMKKDLSKVTVTLEIHEGCKYTAEKIEDLGESTEIEYKGIKSWSIIEGGEEAKAIEMVYGIEDEFHEYLIIEFLNGTMATFRNSHVDMFLI